MINGKAHKQCCERENERPTGEQSLKSHKLKFLEKEQVRRKNIELINLI